MMSEVARSDHEESVVLQAAPSAGNISTSNEEFIQIGPLPCSHATILVERDSVKGSLNNRA
jgi:hypothetical protein